MQKLYFMETDLENELFNTYGHDRTFLQSLIQKICNSEMQTLKFLKLDQYCYNNYFYSYPHSLTTIHYSNAKTIENQLFWHSMIVSIIQKPNNVKNIYYGSDSNTVLARTKKDIQSATQELQWDKSNNINKKVIKFKYTKMINTTILAENVFTIEYFTINKVDKVATKTFNIILLKEAKK